MSARMITLLILLVAIGSLTACSTTVPPTITRMRHFVLRADSPVFLIANRQRERVVRSLLEAGFELSSKLDSDTYSLVVEIGRARWGSSCGVGANVAYILSSYGQNVLVIKGRGKTGDCTPNMLDDMSFRLAETIGK